MGDQGDDRDEDEVHEDEEVKDPGKGPPIRPQDLETLRLAVEMGYYGSPRQCTMEDIAGALGITKSAVYHRISKVEREAVSDLLDMVDRMKKGNAMDEDER